tara:strand:- start:280 stop:909 length:630 start_codon:yes stop_codon:yes gene_type:complete
MSELAILLRNCPHDTTTTGDIVGGIRYERYALKCDSFSIQIAKTPIQIPVPQQAPEIIDIGFYRPSISVGGIIDTIGGDTSIVGPWNSGGDEHTYFRNMEELSISRKNNAGATISDVKYYIPYKNILEEIVYKWITTADDSLELEIGNAEIPVFDRYIEGGNASDDNETGGGLYVVAIQQCRFQVDPATEDRWQFQMQFVCESRKDVTF